MKPIYVKNNIQKKKYLFSLLFSSLFSYHSLLNIFICSIISTLTFYIPIARPLPLRKKKDQLDSCNSHDLIVSFLTFPNFCFQFLCMEEKYEWFSTFHFLRWSQLWSHNSESWIWGHSNVFVPTQSLCRKKRFFLIFTFIYPNDAIMKFLLSQI